MWGGGGGGYVRACVRACARARVCVFVCVDPLQISIIIYYYNEYNTTIEHKVNMVLNVHRNREAY